jgi:hypothetical protein
VAFRDSVAQHAAGDAGEGPHAAPAVELKHENPERIAARCGDCVVSFGEGIWGLCEKKGGQKRRQADRREDGQTSGTNEWGGSKGHTHTSEALLCSPLVMASGAMCVGVPKKSALTCVSEMSRWKANPKSESLAVTPRPSLALLFSRTFDA